jgi:hypothetical protein
VSNDYFWRVTVTDGAFIRTATPSYGTISVVFTTPEVAPPVAAWEEEDPPEPGRVYTSTEAIQYTLPRSGHVRLSVYNLLGQEVALVQNGFQEEGAYTIPPEEIDLPNGIYFYRVRAPGYYDTKKLVVAK